MSEKVKPYNREESKKVQVEQMFDNIARRYDFLNRFLSVGIDVYWRKKAISRLKEKAPRFVLDVATGTADVAMEIHRQLKPEKIIGLDLSEQMLAIGRDKINKKKLSDTIELVKGDSENLPYPDNHFDAVTVAFGVRNFENLQKGLQEMNRVLKPGGRIVILEFSKPQGFPFKQLFQFYFKYILPVIGKITSRDPKAYTYLFESVQAFPQGDEFLSILDKSGFKPGKCIPLTLGICSIYVADK